MFDDGRDGLSRGFIGVHVYSCCVHSFRWSRWFCWFCWSHWSHWLGQGYSGQWTTFNSLDRSDRLYRLYRLYRLRLRPGSRLDILDRAPITPLQAERQGYAVALVGGVCAGCGRRWVMRRCVYESVEGCEASGGGAVCRCPRRCLGALYRCCACEHPERCGEHGVCMCSERFGLALGRCREISARQFPRRAVYIRAFRLTSPPTQYAAQDRPPPHPPPSRAPPLPRAALRHAPPPPVPRPRRLRRHRLRRRPRVRARTALQRKRTCVHLRVSQLLTPPRTSPAATPCPPSTPSRHARSRGTPSPPSKTTTQR